MVKVVAGEATWGGRGASEAEHFAPVTRAPHQETNTWGWKVKGKLNLVLEFTVDGQVAVGIKVGYKGKGEVQGRVVDKFKLKLKFKLQSRLESKLMWKLELKVEVRVRVHVHVEVGHEITRNH